MDSSTNLSQWIPAENNNFSPQTIYFFDHNLNNTTEVTIPEGIRGKNTLIIIVTVTATAKTHLEDTQLSVYLRAILQSNANLKAGVFFVENFNLMDEIPELFMWDEEFYELINVFTAFYSQIDSDPNSEPLFDVFRRDHADQKANFINVTESESLLTLFPDKVPNHLVSGLIVSWSDKLHTSDIAHKILKTLYFILGATVGFEYEFDSVSEFSIEEYDETSDDEHIEFDHEGVVQNVKIYPFRMTALVLLVPHARPYPGFVEYLQNTTWKLLFTYTLIIIAVTSVLLTLSEYLQTKKILLFRSVADVINLLMNDNGAIRYRKLHRLDVLIMVPLTFTGLIVVNGVLSTFQSFLTVPIYERQIKTVEDLFKSPFPILAEEFDVARSTILALRNLSQHGGWRQKVLPVRDYKVSVELQKFKNFAAFAILDEDASQLLEVQKRLNLKAYHQITEVNLRQMFVSFEIYACPNHLIEPLNDIIHRLQSAGLIHKWLKDIEQKKN